MNPASNTPKCPDCSCELPEWKSSHPDLMEAIVFCPNCGIEVKADGTRGAGSMAEWTEHYDGEILRIPDVKL